MDDDEYLNSLVDRASDGVVKYGWYDCVDGFKQADVDMGSAFHRKLEWMNKAADIYLSDNNKMAGFVGKFADDCGVSYDYAKQINRTRKVGCNPQNFSSDALKALMSVPEELREEIVSSGKTMTAPEVSETKGNYNDALTMPEFGDVKKELGEGKITPFEASGKVKERKASMPVVPEYDVAQTMGALKGIAENYGKRYEGSTEDAALILFEEVVKGYHVDDVGMSISRDYVKWLLKLKKVLDLAEPDLLDFLKDKPNLKIVN